jgi:transposase
MKSKSWKKRDIKETKVVACYKTYRSIRKVIHVMHMSQPVVRRIVTEAGFQLSPPNGSSYRGKKKPKSMHGSFAMWLRRNPDVKLPKDLSKIAKMSGCSKDSIKCFLSRLRKRGESIPILRRGKKKSLRPDGSTKE